MSQARDLSLATRYGLDMILVVSFARRRLISASQWTTTDFLPGTSPLHGSELPMIADTAALLLSVHGAVRNHDNVK